jgi:methylenetetrahydrofolate reductase (NADPH)
MIAATIPVAIVPAAPQTGSLLDEVSLEAVMPSAADLHETAAALPAGTPIFLTDLPNRPAEKLTEIAMGVFLRGLRPVPHVAARNVTSAKALGAFLHRVTSAAGVRQVMLIAGDRPSSAGPFADSLALIESGLLQAHGIEAIGIAGYPEGHPSIPDQRLHSALLAKLEAAARASLRVEIVTQFSFEPQPVIDFIRRLRAEGISHPVRIGMAGPASIPSLLKFAQRCGVRASARGFARHASAIGKLLSRATPADMVATLNAAEGMGPVAAHFYSFGGLVQAARWVRDAQAGRADEAAIR